MTRKSEAITQGIVWQVPHPLNFKGAVLELRHSLFEIQFEYLPQNLSPYIHSLVDIHALFALLWSVALETLR